MKSSAVVLQQSSNFNKPKSQIQEKGKKPHSLQGVDLAPKKPHRPPQIWPLPIGALSNAGRLVILRSIGGDEDDIDAKIITDAQLRNIVFADPVMHTLNIYARRIEVLATKAAIAGAVWGYRSFLHEFSSIVITAFVWARGLVPLANKTKGAETGVYDCGYNELTKNKCFKEVFFWSVM